MDFRSVHPFIDRHRSNQLRRPDCCGLRLTASLTSALQIAFPTLHGGGVFWARKSKATADRFDGRRRSLVDFCPVFAGIFSLQACRSIASMHLPGLRQRTTSSTKSPRSVRRRRQTGQLPANGSCSSLDHADRGDALLFRGPLRWADEKTLSFGFHEAQRVEVHLIRFPFQRSAAT